MAKVNTISFGNADLQSEENALQRKQALIDALRKSAMTPLDGGQGTAQAVPISPLLGLGKLGEAYFAKKAEERAQQKQIDIGNEMQKRQAAALKALAPGGTFEPEQPSYSGPMAAPQKAVSPEQRQAWTKALAAYQMDPELGRSMIENLSNATTEQKDMQAMGIDPRLMGALKMAKARKEGVLEVAPNSTAMDMATGGRFVGPDFKSGTFGGFDQNGQPIMGNIAGNAVLPKLAGDIKDAEEAAKARYNMMPVNTPSGPVMMSAEQAARQAGAVPSGGTGGGIPLQTPESLKFGEGVAGTAAADLLKSRDSAKGAANDLFNIDESRKAINGGAYLGSGADLKTDFAKAVKSWVGVDIDPDKVTNSEYLRSTLGNRLLDNAKKLGVNPTDRDAALMANILGTISKDPKALTQLLDFQEVMLKRGIQQHNSMVKDAETRGLKSPYDLTIPLPTLGAPDTPDSPTPPAASVDDLLKKYGGN